MDCFVMEKRYAIQQALELMQMDVVMAIHLIVHHLEISAILESAVNQLIAAQLKCRMESLVMMVIHRHSMMYVI